MRVFLKSSMLACIKFQADWTKADWLPHCFLAPTSCSQRLAWKTKNPVCPHKHCCTAQTCSQRSRFSCDCSHKYLLRACQLTRMYLFFFYISFELYERWSTCVFGASKRMKFWRSYDVKQMWFLDYWQLIVIMSKAIMKKKSSYSQENLIEALNAIRNKTMTYKEAETKFGIPKSTLNDRITGKNRRIWW